MSSSDKGAHGGPSECQDGDRLSDGPPDWTPTPGAFCDVQGRCGRWFEGLIISVSDSFITVRFRGWGFIFDETFPLPTSRVADPYSKVRDWRHQLHASQSVLYLDPLLGQWRVYIILDVEAIEAGRTVWSLGRERGSVMYHIDIESEDLAREGSHSVELLKALTADGQSRNPGGKAQALELIHQHINTQDVDTIVIRSRLLLEVALSGCLAPVDLEPLLPLQLLTHERWQDYRQLSVDFDALTAAYESLVIASTRTRDLWRHRPADTTTPDVLHGSTPPSTTDLLHRSLHLKRPFPTPEIVGDGDRNSQRLGQVLLSIKALELEADRVDSTSPALAHVYRAEAKFMLSYVVDRPRPLGPQHIMDWCRVRLAQYYIMGCGIDRSTVSSQAAANARALQILTPAVSNRSHDAKCFLWVLRALGQCLDIESIMDTLRPFKDLLEPAAYDGDPLAAYWLAQAAYQGLDQSGVTRRGQLQRTENALSLTARALQDDDTAWLKSASQQLMTRIKADLSTPAAVLSHQYALGISWTGVVLRKAVDECMADIVKSHLRKFAEDVGVRCPLEGDDVWMELALDVWRVPSTPSWRETLVPEAWAQRMNLAAPSGSKLGPWTASCMESALRQLLPVARALASIWSSDGPTDVDSVRVRIQEAAHMVAEMAPGVAVTLPDPLELYRQAMKTVPEVQDVAPLDLKWIEEVEAVICLREEACRLRNEVKLPEAQLYKVLFLARRLMRLANSSESSMAVQIKSASALITHLHDVELAQVDVLTVLCRASSELLGSRWSPEEILLHGFHSLILDQQRAVALDRLSHDSSVYLNNKVNDLVENVALNTKWSGKDNGPTLLGAFELFKTVVATAQAKATEVAGSGPRLDLEALTYNSPWRFSQCPAMATADAIEAQARKEPGGLEVMAAIEAGLNKAIRDVLDRVEAEALESSDKMVLLSLSHLRLSEDGVDIDLRICHKKKMLAALLTMTDEGGDMALVAAHMGAGLSGRCWDGINQYFNERLQDACTPEALLNRLQEVHPAVAAITVAVAAVVEGRKQLFLETHLPRAKDPHDCEARTSLAVLLHSLLHLPLALPGAPSAVRFVGFIFNVLRCLDDLVPEAVFNRFFNGGTVHMMSGDTAHFTPLTLGGLLDEIRHAIGPSKLPKGSSPASSLLNSSTIPCSVFRAFVADDAVLGASYRAWAEKPSEPNRFFRQLDDLKDPMMLHGRVLSAAAAMLKDAAVVRLLELAGYVVVPPGFYEQVDHDWQAHRPEWDDFGLNGGHEEEEKGGGEAQATSQALEGVQGQLDTHEPRMVPGVSYAAGPATAYQPHLFEADEAATDAAILQALNEARVEFRPPLSLEELLPSGLDDAADAFLHGVVIEGAQGADLFGPRGQPRLYQDEMDRGIAEALRSGSEYAINGYVLIPARRREEEKEEEEEGGRGGEPHRRKKKNKNKRGSRHK